MKKKYENIKQDEAGENIEPSGIGGDPLRCWKAFGRRLESVPARRHPESLACVGETRQWRAYYLALIMLEYCSHTRLGAPHSFADDL